MVDSRKHRVLNNHLFSMNSVSKLCIAFVCVIVFTDLLYASRENTLQNIINKNTVSVENAKQVIIVTNNYADSEKAILYTFEQSGKEWKTIFTPMDVVIGKKGFASIYDKREGDKKTPSGVFQLGTAFGYQKSVETKLQYRQTTINDYWVDDALSIDYNKWVTKKPISGTYEVLRRKDNSYKYAIVVNYNMKPVVNGFGSAIFLHLWKNSNKGTSGCIAMSEVNMKRVLSWLDLKQNPILITGSSNSLLRLETLQELSLLLSTRKSEHFSGDNNAIMAVYSSNSTVKVLRDGTLPKNFTYLDKIIPDAIIDIRYATSNNFVGERISGYESKRCVITSDAANALKLVQDELRPYGLGIKIFDAYRPVSAVDHFVRWSKSSLDTRMKNAFYPNLNKSELFAQKFIGSRSGHSKGSSVDLTIVSAKGKDKGKELDMGTRFDFFDKASIYDYAFLSQSQKDNRRLLREIMQKYGFSPYNKEWWHFVLKDEPFPKQQFDFPSK